MWTFESLWRHRDLRKLRKKNLFAKTCLSNFGRSNDHSPRRERGNDVLLLADHLLERIPPRNWKPGLQCRLARDRCCTTAVGNVRELQNTLERAVILAMGCSIRARGLQLPHERMLKNSGGDAPENFNW